MSRAQNLYASHHFGADFEAPLEVEIELMIAFWKALPVYFPTQVEFLDLVSICPSKCPISQDYFLCVKIGVVRSFFECFFDHLRAQNFPKFLGHG